LWDVGWFGADEAMLCDMIFYYPAAVLLLQLVDVAVEFMELVHAGSPAFIPGSQNLWMFLHFVLRIKERGILKDEVHRYRREKETNDNLVLDLTNMPHG
jgi:hypothetical protein